MATLLFGFADQPQERNTSVHRCEVPARILSETGRHKCGLLHISHLQNPHPTKEVQDAINDAEIIILERLLLKEIQPRIEEWHKAGKKVISTFDDAYHLMPKSGGISEQTWRGGKKAKVGKNADGSDKVGSILNEFRDTLRMMDTALVPSRVLADDYRPYCPTIQYVPNFLYKGMWENLKRRPLDNNFIVGWGGSTAHDIGFRESHLPQALGIIAK